MSVARELRRAAGRLRTLAESSHTGEHPGGGYLTTHRGPRHMCPAPDCAEYRNPSPAAMHPGVALDLANLLDALADEAEAGHLPTAYAGDVADAINGSAS